MRVLVTGASGMLGATLVERWASRHQVYATGGAEFAPPASWAYRPFDLTATDHSPLIQWARPDAIVHCAAWTAVDACEGDPERAREVNAKSGERLAIAAPDARIVYVSSDAVFGEHSAPVRETDATNPINVYGRTKLLGETLLSERGVGVSVRTTVLGWNRDPRKRSWIEWLVRSLENRTPIGLFVDALFTPIAATLLADELEYLLAERHTGVWHVTGREEISKHDFGVRLCDRLGLDRTLISRTRIADMRFAAPRSADQRLDVASYERTFDRRLPAVEETIEALVRDRTRVTER